MRPARHHFLRGVVTYVSLAAALVATTLTLSQCTMVGDNVTGVRVTHTGFNECEKQCTQDFLDKVTAETKRHAEELQRCSGLPASDRLSCIEAENQLFVGNLKALLDAWRACKNGCHSQGAGDAG